MGTSGVIIILLLLKCNFDNNESLFNEVLGKKNNILPASYSEVYGKGLQYYENFL